MLIRACFYSGLNVRHHDFFHTIGNSARYSRLDGWCLLVAKVDMYLMPRRQKQMDGTLCRTARHREHYGGNFRLARSAG